MFATHDIPAPSERTLKRLGVTGDRVIGWETTLGPEPRGPVDGGAFQQNESSPNGWPRFEKDRTLRSRCVLWLTTAGPAARSDPVLPPL
jgi:hypothetical protein